MIEGAIEVRDAPPQRDRPAELCEDPPAERGCTSSPLAPIHSSNWDAVKAFSKWVADRLAQERPAQFTANPAKRERRGRIYLDYLRNGRGATAVGAYSPRDRAGTTVSTPVTWDEVESGMRPTAFTVATVPGAAGGAGERPFGPSWRRCATVDRRGGAGNISNLNDARSVEASFEAHCAGTSG